MEIIRRVDGLRWREFVDAHPQGAVFHTPEMFQVFECAKGYSPSVWATIDRDGRVLALLLPSLVTTLPGWLRHLSTRAIVYGSVLCASGAEGQQALALLLRQYRQEVDRAVLFTELRNLSSLDELQPTLREQGFVYEDHLSYVVDLKRPSEAVFHSIGPRTRKHIRRGLRLGQVTIREANTQEDVAAGYHLLRQSYQAARVPLADRSLFEAAFDLLHPKGMIRFLLADVGQTPIAASVELVYKDVIYGWYSGLDRAYGHYLPNELLTWHILQWGAENGYAVYDFGGAGKPGENYGVRNFKAKFGGRLVNYGRNVCVHAPARLRLSQAGYQLVRKFL